VWLFDAATRIVPMLPTFWASTTGAADCDGVAVGEGDGDAVAAVPPVGPPQAASMSAEKASTVEARRATVIVVIM